MSDIFMPSQVRALPRNHAGYPVPWFVASIDGEPDFRVIRARGIEEAVEKRLCWVCGQRRAKAKPDAFVIGPMCAVNRVSAEPPSHQPCAMYAARACPSLSNPKKRRREGNKPVTDAPAGEMIARNPGVALVWLTRSWSQFDDGNGGKLFDVGRPVECFWIAEGREVGRDEVLASLESGLPILREMAETECPEAVEALDRQYERALLLVPA